MSNNPYFLVQGASKQERDDFVINNLQQMTGVQSGMVDLPDTKDHSIILFILLCTNLTVISVSNDQNAYEQIPTFYIRHWHPSFTADHSSK